MRTITIFLTCMLIPTTFGWADEPETTRYTVTLLKVKENRYPEKRTEPINVRLTIDDIVQQNKERTKDDGKDFWNFEPRDSREVNLTCLKGQPLGKSFVLQLDTVHHDGHNRVGKVKVTLRQEKGEVRPAFEMKHGKRTRELRRSGRKGGIKHWYTLVFPVEGTKSANFRLSFKIDKDQ